MARDPVCYMDVDESAALKAKRFSQYEGSTYYFCCDECRQQFEEFPWFYAKPGREAELRWNDLPGRPG